MIAVLLYKRIESRKKNSNLMLLLMATELFPNAYSEMRVRAHDASRAKTGSEHAFCEWFIWRRQKWNACIDDPKWNERKKRHLHKLKSLAANKRTVHGRVVARVLAYHTIAMWAVQCHLNHFNSILNCSKSLWLIRLSAHFVRRVLRLQSKQMRLPIFRCWRRTWHRFRHPNEKETKWNLKNIY